MLTLIIIFLSLLLLNLLLAWGELIPFIHAVEEVSAKRTTISEKISLPFRMIGTIPKMIPCILDCAAIMGVAALFRFGNSIIASIGGLFASNVISLIIFQTSHKHLRVWEVWRKT